MTRLAFLASAVAISALTWTAPVAAQQPDQKDHHPAGDQKAEMPKQEAHMMQMRQKMMGDMKAMDGKLDTLVTKMNAATGQAKVDVMAELVTVMAQQRAMMRDGMMQMQGEMMGHMMQHMSGGMSPDMKTMMAECPMMKQMGTAK